MILLDTSGVLAAIDDDQPRHMEAKRSLVEAEPPLLLSPFVLGELDHLVGARVGRAAALEVLREVAAGSYRLEGFGAADVRAARKVLERYADLDVGLTDASIVVLAERHRVRDVLTLDERHFRALRGPSGRPFRLLPADA